MHTIVMGEAAFILGVIGACIAGGILVCLANLVDEP